MVQMVLTVHLAMNIAGGCGMIHERNGERIGKGGAEGNNMGSAEGNDKGSEEALAGSV